MLSLLLTLTFPAWSLDTEPNDSAAAAEPITGVLTAQYGELSSSTDQDWYRISFRAPTEVSLWLERWAVAADNDFDVELYSECGDIVSATSTGGSRRLLQYSATAGEEVCVRVFSDSFDDAGAGRYMLSMTREVEPPTVTGISPLDGDGEPYGAPGDVVTITGSGFDAAPQAISVTFGHADGYVTNATDTEIRVRVPWFAGNGRVKLNMAGVRRTWEGFTVSGGERARPSFESPGHPASAAMTMTGPYGPYDIYPHYIWVDFAGHAAPGAASAALALVDAANSDVDGFTVEGLDWTDNRYYVQWSWVADPTPAAYRALRDQLLAHPLVESVFAHSMGVTAHGIGHATDVHAAGALDPSGETGLAWHFAAQRQVGLEEAWRIWRTGPGLEAAGTEPVRVLVLDSGLVGGDWGEGEELPAIGSGATIGTTMWALGSNRRWISTTSFTDAMATAAALESHGTAVVGIIAAANHGLTPLDAGAASADAMEHDTPGFNGVLTGFSHYDDGQPLVEVHVAAVGDPDSVDGQTMDVDRVGSVFKLLREGEFGDDPDTSNDESFDPDIISISLGLGDTDLSAHLVPYLTGLRTKADDPSTTGVDESQTSPLVVVSAGNVSADTTAVQGLADALGRLSGAPWFNEEAAEHVLVVGGTHGRPRFLGGAWHEPDDRGVYGSAGGGAPGIGSAFGNLVTLAAPMDGWNGIQYDAGSATHGFDYDLGDDIGTSIAAPAVTALAALLKATNPDLTAPELRRLLASTGPDISERWGAGLAGGASAHPMHRLDATAALVQTLGRSETTYLDTNVYVYTLDRGNSASASSSPARLYARAVEPSGNPSGGVYAAGDPISAAIGLDLEQFDCWEPVDVTVDPRGDVVYVVCKGVSPHDGGRGDVCEADWTVHAFHASLQADIDENVWLGCVDLAADSSPSAEIVVGSDQILVAATASGAQLVVEHLDTMHGGLATLPTYGTGRLETHGDYVVGAELDGLQRAVLGLTIGDYSDDDGDTLARVEPLSLTTREVAEPDSYDFSREAGTYALTDVAPARIDDSGVAEHDILAVFETSHGAWGTGDVEGVWIAEDLETSEALEFEYAEWPFGAALDPQVGSTSMWLADFDDGLLSTYDTMDTSPWSPGLSCGSPTSSAADYPVAIEYADNGQFVVAAWQHTSTAGSSRSLADNATTCDWSGAHSTTYLYDIEAVAISPTISILSPRPGTLIDGFRRFVVLVRDPYVDHFRFETWDKDGYLLTTNECVTTYAIGEPAEDLPVHPGIYDDCQIDGQDLPTSGTGGEAARYRVTISAVYPDGTEGAQLTAWYER